MIGHYLLTLTPEQEGLVLTQTMGPGGKLYRRSPSPGCLLQCATGMTEWWVGVGDTGHELDTPFQRIAYRYDRTCERFGTERVNRAIRNRILTNQARRALRQAPSMAGGR